ncbi:MAG: hypothetical protein JXB62_15720 [Pirellulales bacterium]|nr:hypothetical protein [Pirellulales bacterium]
MARCCFVGVLTCLLAAVSLATSATAGDLLGLVRGHGSPSGSASPWRQVAAPPGPHRYPQYNAASAPWSGYGFGVPTYSWGYFGARYRPAVICHKGYYGDMTQWGYRVGY